MDVYICVYSHWISVSTAMGWKVSSTFMHLNYVSCMCVCVHAGW